MVHRKGKAYLRLMEPTSKLRQMTYV